MHNEIDSFSLNVIDPDTFIEHKHPPKKRKKRHIYTSPDTEEKSEKKAFLEEHFHFQSASNKCEMDRILNSNCLIPLV